MKTIRDPNRLKTIIRETDFQSFFSNDISEIAELLFAETGEILIEESIPSDYLFYLVSGQIRYFTLAPTGNYIIFGASKNDMFFGQVSSLWGEKPTASVEAVTDILCLGINLNKYRSIIQNDVRFLGYNCRLLAKMINNLDNTISSYVSGQVNERLASFIIQNAVNNVFSLSLVATSNALGTSYRHLQRLMKAFCEQGYLRKEKRSYTILKPKQLKDLASENYIYFY